MAHDLLHGRNLIIKADGEPLALSKSCTVDVQCDTIQVSGPATGQWEESILGRKKWEVNCSHLMYNRGSSKPLDRMDMVGQEVTINIDIMYEDAVAFNGFVENVAIEEGSVSVGRNFAWVVYDTVNKLFLLSEGSNYYKEWTYTDGSFNPYLYNTVNNNRIYENIGTGDIVGEYYKAEKNTAQQNIVLTRRDTTRRGQAIVRQWSGTFTWGNLAQGSFKFLGKGPLAPVITNGQPEEEGENEEE